LRAQRFAPLFFSSIHTQQRRALLWDGGHVLERSLRTTAGCACAQAQLERPIAPRAAALSGRESVRHRGRCTAAPCTAAGTGSDRIGWRRARSAAPGRQVLRLRRARWGLSRAAGRRRQTVRQPGEQL